MSMRLRVVLWDKDFSSPHQHSIEVQVGTPVFLWDDAWMRERASHDALKLYEVWCRTVGNWRTFMAHQIYVLATQEVPTVLVRRHTVGHLRCPGLGGELTVLEEAAGFSDAALVVPIVGHNIDLNRAEPKRCVRVVIWNETNEHPKSFHVHIDPSGVMKLSDYQRMLDALFGAEIPPDACMAIWEPMGDYWRSSAYDDIVGFADFNNTVLVRHMKNVLPAGAGRRISLLHRETFRGYIEACGKVAVAEYIEEQAAERATKHVYGTSASIFRFVNLACDTAIRNSGRVTIRRLGAFGAFVAGGGRPPRDHQSPGQTHKERRRERGVPGSPGYRPRQMTLYRAYFRPGQRGARPLFHVASIPKKSYPEDVKLLCNKGAAARVPPDPERCPHDGCGVQTLYWKQVCYMEGLAGAYIFIGRSCNHRHYPVQEGPSEDLLEEIEAARSLQNAMQPSPDRPSRGRPSQPKTSAGRARSSTEVTTSQTSLQKKLLAHGKTSKPKTQKKARPINPHSVEVTDAPDVIASGGPGEQPATGTPNLNDAPAKKRPWQLDEGTEGEVISVQDIWWISRHGDEFEWWSLDLACWLLLASSADDIDVPAESDTVLVRVRGVKAAGFASELFLIELTCGWVAQVPQSDDMVGERCDGWIWTLLWVEDHAGPLVFKFRLPSSRLLCLESTQAYRDGVTGLEGARKMAYWDEVLGNWKRFSKSSTLYIEPNCPFVLLRREDAFSIHRLGQALRSLERQRGYPATTVVDPTRLATPADRTARQEGKLAVTTPLSPASGLPTPNASQGSTSSSSRTLPRERSLSIEFVDDPDELARVAAHRAQRAQSRRQSGCSV
ncbi:hypothetical protein C8Q76DRAFT_789633 [Earliella scabrosa]|nr:hypothetical protein C8Q76DRAFT_789633 [Earliella scabrosa]